MRTETQRPRRKWPWAAGGAIVVAALVVAVAAWYGNQPHGPDGKPETTTTATAHPTADASGAPTGCLGGQGRDAMMVLAAQHSATHTTAGAVEFAASFNRWIQRFPYPPAAESNKITQQVLTKDAFTKDLAGYFETAPDMSGGIVPAGTPYYMSTVPGVWHLESSTADEVRASIGTGYVIDGALSPTLRSSITVTVVWENGTWKISQAAGTRTTQQLFSIGQQFAGGC